MCAWTGLKLPLAYRNHKSFKIEKKESMNLPYIYNTFLRNHVVTVFITLNAMEKKIIKVFCLTKDNMHWCIMCTRYCGPENLRKRPNLFKNCTT